MATMVTVKGRQCPYDPSVLVGLPLGQFHCTACGCMVIAGLPHGACFPSFCPAADEGWHPGTEIDVEVGEDDLPWLGLDDRAARQQPAAGEGERDG